MTSMKAMWVAFAVVLVLSLFFNLLKFEHDWGLTATLFALAAFYKK